MTNTQPKLLLRARQRLQRADQNLIAARNSVRMQERVALALVRGGPVAREADQMLARLRAALRLAEIEAESARAAFVAVEGIPHWRLHAMAVENDEA